VQSDKDEEPDELEDRKVYAASFGGVSSAKVFVLAKLITLSSLSDASPFCEAFIHCQIKSHLE
jgi:hypothetical protein